MSDEQDRWERLQALLDELEALPEARWREHLEQRCPDDPALREEALALMAAQSASRGFLDGVASRLGRMPGGQPDPSGRRIGAYRLLRPLGRGGMGMVYEAQRADGAFEQRVALKLLTTALTGTEAHGRFLAERRILAGLEHPAIARIVDGGVTDDDTPWFAMEYVEGQPMDVFCDRQRLDIQGRLALFLQVCDAVDHAHRSLVVHRDLKPANVLVGTSPGDGRPRVKLLDFGIAKLLEDETAGQPTVPATRAGLRLMTPEYASPEQVRGDQVTTASDVYQLGLLLYELLTGHRPYQVRHGGAGEYERVICEQRPARPSSVITRRRNTSGAEADAICRARRLSLTRLRRRLRGDLENIVLKALSKEPERRYGSADRLAQDIRRHLRGQPVSARPDTWTYRSRKFLQRHAVAATATTLVVVLVAAMTTFYTLRIQNERDLARAEAAKAAQVSELLIGLFRSADPREARGAELTARELLDRGVERIGRELATQPEIRADMLYVLGRTYLELSLYPSARQMLDQALALRRQHLGPHHPDVARILADLGLYHSRRGEHEPAREHLEQAVALLERPGAGRASDLSTALAQLGNTYKNLGLHEQSRMTLERALEIEAVASGGHSEAAALILQAMGDLHRDMGNYVQAEHLQEQALIIVEQVLGEDHPRVGNALMSLANARVVQGRTDGVEHLYRRSLHIHEQAYGPDHTMVGVTLHNLGYYLNATGQTAQAIDATRRALAIYGNTLGTTHPDTAYPHATLGAAHAHAGDHERAQHHYRQVIALREHAARESGFDYLQALALTRLGVLEQSQDTEAAAAYMEHALTLWQAAPDFAHPSYIAPLVDLGRWLVTRQRCDQALPLLRKAEAIRATRHPDAEPGDTAALIAACETHA